MLYQETLICILLSLNLCSGVTDLSDTDYCTLCTEKKSHTACQYPSAKPPDACKLQTLTADEKVALLRKHNELRGRAARGEDGMPKASNMMRMRWDMELEAVAARWALQCIDKHDKCRVSTRFSVGQNIAWRKPLDLLSMVQDWYNEITEFSKDDINPFKFKYSTGHYTQVVWAKTYLVGCALTDRGDAPGIQFTLVCNYGPGGNVVGTPMYLEGEAASACPEGSKPDTTYTGLCATSQEDFEDMKLHPSIRLKAPASAAPMPLTVLLALAMVFSKCWDLLCAVTAI